jgi:hypothetical protein
MGRVVQVERVGQKRNPCNILQEALKERNYLYERHLEPLHLLTHKYIVEVHQVCLV